MREIVTRTGTGFFNDEYKRSLRTLDPKRYNDIPTIYDNIAKISATSHNGEVVADTLFKKLYGRVTAYMNDYDLSGGMVSNDPENVARALKKMVAKSAKDERYIAKSIMATESTVMRPAGILKSLAGDFARTTHSALGDNLEAYARRVKGRGAVAGFVAGAFAAMGMNQLVSGYSIPGLERMGGLGGEYYEQEFGIIGRDAEILSSRKPPRITPSYKDGVRIQRQIGDIANMTSFNVRPPQPGQLRNNFRGVITS